MKRTANLATISIVLRGKRLQQTEIFGPYLFLISATCLAGIFLFTAGAISVFAMGFVSDWLVKKRGLKFGRRLIGISFPCIGAIIFFLLGFIDNNTVVIICLFTAYLFVGSAPGNSFSTCIDIGCNNVGAVAGIMNTVGQSAGFVVGIVVGRLVHVTHSYTSSLFVIAAVLVGGAMMWLWVDPAKKISSEPQVLKLEQAVLV